ncbi:MAG: hypothetical protein ABC585_06715 [Candidatus Methanosuratincola petrocarbonis]|nr:hypothetical protein [Candidatus Methanosuratincola sp.]
MRHRSRRLVKKVLIIGFLPVLILAALGNTYALLFQTLEIHGVVHTGFWGGGGVEGPCVGIQKTLDGAFTNATTGEDLSERTDLIHIGNANPPYFPTKFKLTICVHNCGNETLTGVVVTDRLENQFGVINWSANTGDVTILSFPGPGNYSNEYIVWEVGALQDGEGACLEMWIQTLQNPAGWYAPTSGGTTYIINQGASVFATSSSGDLWANTGSLSISLSPEGDNHIATILTQLPYSTPWEYSP